eukprot:TRINITY_DN2005_c0_g1_i14.p2 TRINITY_DN2005_c0_g1~~TRINITY_DN2005_c0_g1_i14.p2  ORF type:complete len:215 (+),score=28.43 TRINITY_DN2005_c0_g1_i14:125-769(+)
MNVVQGEYQRVYEGDSLQANFDDNSSNFLQKPKLTTNIESQLHQQAVNNNIAQNQDQQLGFSSQQLVGNHQSYSGSNQNSQVGQFSQNEEGAGKPQLASHFFHCEDEISSESNKLQEGIEQQLDKEVEVASNKLQNGQIIRDNNLECYNQDQICDTEGEQQKRSMREAGAADYADQLVSQNSQCHAGGQHGCVECVRCASGQVGIKKKTKKKKK